MKATVNNIFRSLIALLLVVCMVFSTGGSVFAASKESATTNGDRDITKELQSLYQLLKEEGVTDAESTQEHSYVKQLKKMMPEWKAEIRNYFGNIKPDMEASIVVLKEELAILETESEDKKDIAKIAQIKKDIENLEAKIFFVDEKMEALSVELVNISTVMNGPTNTGNEGVDGLIEQMQSAFTSMGQALKISIDLLSEIDGAMIEMKGIVNDILDDIKSIDEAKLGGPVEKARPRLNNAMDELDAAAKEGSDGAGDLLLAKMKETAKILREDATTGVYTMTDNPYYVSIGDASVTGFGLEDYKGDNYGYKEKLAGTFSYEYAKALGLDTDTQYAQLGISGLRAEDIRYILDETCVPDAYGEEVVVPMLEDIGLDSVRAAYEEEIKKAHLISVSFGFNEITNYVAAQLNEYIKFQEQPYAIDWQRYVDAETEVKIQEILASLKTKLKESGMGTINLYIREMDLAEIVGIAVESYAYAYVSFLLNYTKILETIHEWNPDAQVVLVGMYNPMRGMSIDLNGSVMPVGDYIEYFIQLTNMFYTSYAMLISNTTLVKAPDVTFDMDTTEPVAVTKFITSILFKDCKSLQANAEGHAYIKNQIEEAISIHKHAFKTTWTYDDVSHWHGCTCEVKKEEASHSFTDKKDTTCNVCGYVRVIEEEKPPVVIPEPSAPSQGGSTTVPEQISAPKTVNLSKTTYTFNGEMFEPTVMVTDEKNAVIDPTYYTVSYTNNKNAGTATVTVAFKDKYASFGKKEVTFIIKQASYKSVEIKDVVYTGKKIKKITLITSSGEKLSSSDYTVLSKSFKKNTKIGTATVKIKFKGKNIKATTKTLKFKIIPKSTSIRKLVKGKKQIKVTFKKAKNISGYQIQYSTSKKFANKTTKTIKNIKSSKSSYIIKKLKAKKTYYIRIRTYKKAGKTYYSSWSKAKSIRTR